MQSVYVLSAFPLFLVHQYGVGIYQGLVDAS